MDTGELIFLHEFTKRQGEKIQVVLKKFKGKYYVDLRLWFQTGPDQNFFPSQKGVTFELEHLTEFSRGVEQLIQAAANLQNRSERQPAEPPKQTQFTGQRRSLQL